MKTTLEVLQERFPGRIMLDLAAVADVLYQRGDRAAQEAVRAGIARGTVLPGLRKVTGKWLVPITTLAAWLDSLNDQRPSAPPVERVVHHHVTATTSTPRRGRQPDSVRIPLRQARLAAQRMRAQGFFSTLLAEFQHMRLGAMQARPGSRPLA